MAEESKVEYLPLSRESSVKKTRGTSVSPKYIITTGDYSSRIKRLRLFGGYEFGKRYWIISVVIIYHFLNIAYAGWTFDPIFFQSLCELFAVTVLFIQLQALVLYLIACRALNSSNPCPVSQYICCKCCKPNDYDINLVFTERYKSPLSSCSAVLIWMFVLILFLVCIISAMITWVESKDNYTDGHDENLDRYWIQLVLYLLDMFKWSQMIIIVRIIYEFLDTFPEAMNQFESDIKTVMKAGDYINLETDPVHKPPVVMYEFPQGFDIAKFKIEYNQFTKSYEKPMQQFHFFIVIFCLCLVIMCGLLILTLVWSYKYDTQCTDDDILPFFIHYASEILLYFVLWCIILIKLNRCHQLLLDYKTKINSNVAMDCREVLTFLQGAMEDNSPFRIYKYNPTWGKIFFFFGSFVVPFIWNMIIIRDSFDVSSTTTTTSSAPSGIPTSVPTI